VIDAVRFITHIHRNAMPEGYRSVIEMQPDQQLVPQVTPALAVVLGNLELE